MTDSPRQSMLAQMTAKAVEEKQRAGVAARQLTPVAGERGALPTTPAPFPNDVPTEVVHQQIIDLDHVIRRLTEARDALAALIHEPPAGKVVDLAEKQKEKEREADFNAAYKAKQAEAQEAVFESGPVLGIANVDWVCPDHGKAIEKTSKAGRSYIGCPECNYFKRD